MSPSSIGAVYCMWCHQMHRIPGQKWNIVCVFAFVVCACVCACVSHPLIIVWAIIVLWQTSMSHTQFNVGNIDWNWANCMCVVCTEPHLLQETRFVVCLNRNYLLWSRKPFDRSHIVATKLIWYITWLHWVHNHSKSSALNCNAKNFRCWLYQWREKTTKI